MDCEVDFEVVKDYDVMKFIDGASKLDPKAKIYFNTSCFLPVDKFRGEGWKKLSLALKKSGVDIGFKLSINGGNKY